MSGRMRANIEDSENHFFHYHGIDYDTLHRNSGMCHVAFSDENSGGEGGGDHIRRTRGK